MTVKEFCEKSLSNDLIGFVDDVFKDTPTEVKAAYRFLLEDNQDILNREIKRFTYGGVKGCNRDVLIIQIEQ